MTPGVWLSLACADLTNTRRLWDAVRAHAPPAWGLNTGDPALCAAIGIAPEDMLSAEGAPDGLPPLALTLLFHAGQREIQLLNALALDGTGVLEAADTARAVAAWVIECAKPVIDQLAAEGIATEISVARGGVR